MGWARCLLILFFPFFHCSLNAAEDKEKILFILHGLGVGGSEKALINMINALEYTDEDIEIALLQTDGNNLAFLSQLKKSLKIFSINEARQRKYKTVVAFGEWLDSKEWISIPAQRRVLWVHNDLIHNMYKKSPVYGRDKLHNIDAFVCVSDHVKQTFMQIHPDLSSKAQVIYNFHDNENILAQAEAPIDDMVREEGSLTFVTVGRLWDQKALDRAVRVSGRLKEEGFRFKWYIIGDGPERKNLERLIAFYNVREECILLGTRLNPYPYIRKADLFVLTSMFEGCPMVFSEAKILGCPIVTTEVSGARELIRSGEEGLIIENNENEIYWNLKKLLVSPSLVQQFHANLKDFRHDNGPSIELVRKIVEERDE